MVKLLQKIGSSKGLILNQTMLEHLGVTESVEIQLESGRIVISAPAENAPKPPRRHRQSFVDAKNSTIAQFGAAFKILAAPEVVD